jgi:hypothetical protein
MDERAAWLLCFRISGFVVVCTLIVLALTFADGPFAFGLSIIGALAGLVAMHAARKLRDRKRAIAAADAEWLRQAYPPHGGVDLDVADGD